MDSNRPDWDTPQKPDDLNAEYMTVQETAWVFGCSVRTIRRYVNENGAHHSRIAGRIVFSRADRQALYDLCSAGTAPRRVPAQRRRKPLVKRSAAPKASASTASRAA